MIGCLRTCVRKQPIIALYFEFETVLKFYNLGGMNILRIECVPNLFGIIKYFEKSELEFSLIYFICILIKLAGTLNLLSLNDILVIINRFVHITPFYINSVFDLY